MIWLISCGVWTLIAFASGFSMYQFDRSLGKPATFHDELILPLINDLIFAFLTPLVFVKVLRFPIWESNWGQRLVAYVAAAFGFTVAHIIFRGLVFPVWDPRVKGYAYPFWDLGTHTFTIQWVLLKRLFLYNVVDDIVSTYLLIVLLGHLVCYYQRLRERELHTAQLETELAKADLRALKSQLQPHFLFNTLHSISALMLTNVAAADRMMTRLSDLLRMSLENRGIQITSIKCELEFAASYLEIEKIRFQDRLRVIFDVSPETLDALVPHLLLQPLVENAVRHGISRTIQPGEIRISVTHDGQNLFLQVTNDCPDAVANELDDLTAGLGLRTTRGRLERLYGDAQGLDIRSGTNGAFDVCIRIPLSFENSPGRDWNREQFAAQENHEY